MPPSKLNQTLQLLNLKPLFIVWRCRFNWSFSNSIHAELQAFFVAQNFSAPFSQEIAMWYLQTRPCDIYFAIYMLNQKCLKSAFKMFWNIRLSLFHQTTVLQERRTGERKIKLLSKKNPRFPSILYHHIDYFNGNLWARGWNSRCLIVKKLH